MTTLPNGIDIIADGFGNAWPRICPDCGQERQIVRPGKVQCDCTQSEIHDEKPDDDYIIGLA